MIGELLRQVRLRHRAARKTTTSRNIETDCKQAAKQWATLLNSRSAVLIVSPGGMLLPSKSTRGGLSWFNPSKVAMLCTGPNFTKFKTRPSETGFDSDGSRSIVARTRSERAHSWPHAANLGPTYSSWPMLVEFGLVRKLPKAVRRCPGFG